MRSAACAGGKGETWRRPDRLLNHHAFAPPICLCTVAGRIVLSFKPPGFFDKYGEEALHNTTTVEGEPSFHERPSSARRRARLRSTRPLPCPRGSLGSSAHPPSPFSLFQGLEDAELARRVAEHRAGRYVVLSARQGEPELPDALKKDLDSIMAKRRASGEGDDGDGEEEVLKPHNAFAALMGEEEDEDEESEGEESEEGEGED